MLHRDTFGVVDLPDPIASAEFHTEPAQPAAVIKIDGRLRSQIDAAAAREGLTPDSWLETAIASRLSTSRPAAA